MWGGRLYDSYCWIYSNGLKGEDRTQKCVENGKLSLRDFVCSLQQLRKLCIVLDEYLLYL